MILYLFVFGAISLVLWHLLAHQSPPIDGVYRLPGKWYTFKKLMFLMLFKYRSYKNKKESQKNKEREKTGTKLANKDKGYGAGDIDPEILEDNPPLLEDKDGIDSVYFNGFQSDGTKLAIRFCRRHNREAEIWIFLEIPGIGCLVHPLHPDTNVIDTNGRDYAGGGLKIQMVEPMRVWKVSFNGQLRRGASNRLVSKGDNFLRTQFNFIWVCTCDPFNFDTDIHPEAIADAIAKEQWTKEFWDRLKSKHQTHYEQWGVLRGEINVEGYEPKQLYLKSIRDHTFGIRDWRNFYRYGIHFICLENGHLFQVGVVSLPVTTSNLQIGWMCYPSGQINAIKTCDLKLWEVAKEEGPLPKYSFSFVGDNQTFDVTVETKVTQIFYHHEDRGSKVMEVFCDYTVNGLKGYGLVEFHYRNYDGPSYVPQTSVPLLKEPSYDAVKDKSGAIVLPFMDDACACSFLVGGKGAQLSLLSKMQNDKNCTFQVPKGFCVTLAAFKEQVNDHKELNEALNKIVQAVWNENETELRKWCSDAVELFASTPMLEKINKEIAHFLSSAESPLVPPYAVRSSASGEDGTESSSAGQMETFLGVQKFNEVIESVQKCWASAFTFQAVQYRRQNGQPIRVRVGVVIQEIIQSEVSGVLFTHDPVSGSPNLMKIDASYGLGEAIVSGKTTPDTITINRSWEDDLSIKDIHLGSKKVQIYIKDGDGVEETSSENSNSCCMSQDQILSLAKEAIKIEKYLGSPRDIEWAYAGGTFYMLQARPITTLDTDTVEDLLHEFDDPISCEKEWLTTANIGEMMPMAVTPLTKSIFINYIDKGMTNFAHWNSGFPANKYCRRPVITICNHGFINMNIVGMIGLSNIIGKKDGGELAILGHALKEMTEEQIQDFSGVRHFPFWRRLKVFAGMILEQRRQLQYLEDLESKLDTFAIETYVEEPMTLYNNIQEKLQYYSGLWMSTVFKSAVSGVWANVVIGIISQGGSEWTHEHCADVALLLSKCDEVYSAEVPTAMQNIAAELVHLGLEEQFVNSTDEHCVQMLCSEETPSLKSMYDTFMKRHGHRYIREAEFLEGSWKREPESLAKVLKTILKTKSYVLKDREILTVTEAMARIQSPTTFFARQMLKLIVPKARKAVGGREWGKSTAVKLSDIFKEAFWQLAGLMVKQGRLPERELMFFLTFREIKILLETRSSKLLNRAVKRRKIYPLQMKISFPLLSCGVPEPVHVEDFKSKRTASFVLKGMPVYQGVVIGRACVVTNLEQANQIQRDDILIVPYTDVGWTPYFPIISGLVTELGGLLSHGAVVAREYGLPCIVSVSNATNMLQSGDMVRLDGKNGYIEKLNQAE